MTDFEEAIANLLADILEEQRKTRDALLVVAGLVSASRTNRTAPSPAVEPATEPARTLAPTSVPAPSPAAAPVEAPEAESVGLDQLRVAFGEATKAGHKAALVSILEHYRAKKLTDLDQSAYAEVLQKVKAL